MSKLNKDVLAGGAGMTEKVAETIEAIFDSDHLALADPIVLAARFHLPEETAEWLTLLAAWANSISALPVHRRTRSG